ncbi:hypothetical protein B840_12510 (plasmid) [Corynebacterium marinum DSM 44953]|uniref:Uncharacterized protein n=1 Tax=Corynebacterium marinum DSM 44953 TaxID=1224162 RepID=A0A0B6TWU9_9CORY|nr:hypothetical protein B840_12510 [Corynebacterium marinum DSM 44953]
MDVEDEHHRRIRLIPGKQGGLFHPPGVIGLRTDDIRGNLEPPDIAARTLAKVLHRLVLHHQRRGDDHDVVDALTAEVLHSSSHKIGLTGAGGHVHHQRVEWVKGAGEVEDQLAQALLIWGTEVEFRGDLIDHALIQGNGKTRHDLLLLRA